MFRRNKKLIIAIITIVAVFLGVLIFAEVMGGNGMQSYPAGKEGISTSDSSLDIEKNYVNTEEDIIIQGTGEEEQEIVIEGSEDKTENAKKVEDDFAEENIDSGVDRFKDGPYAYITIEDLCNHGKELEGMNVYTVGEIMDISEGVVLIRTENKNEPVVVYVYEDINAKVGDPIAFYGFVVASENNNEKGSAFVEAIIIKAGNGANAYKEAETDKELLSFLQND